MAKLIILTLLLTACGTVETETHSAYKDAFCFGVCFTHDAKLDTQTTKTKDSKKAAD
jgi:hypothetical protein